MRICVDIAQIICSRRKCLGKAHNRDTKWIIFITLYIFFFCFFCSLMQTVLRYHITSHLWWWTSCNISDHVDCECECWQCNCTVCIVHHMLSLLSCTPCVIASRFIYNLQRTLSHRWWRWTNDAVCVLLTHLFCGQFLFLSIFSSKRSKQINSPQHCWCSTSSPNSK